jgi:flagellar hook-length control protein FliK
MSAPVMPSGPAVRGQSTGGASDTGGAESAAPFASALDGALSESRGRVDDGATGEGQSQDTGAPAAAVVPVDAAVAPPVDLAAALFAFALGQSQTAGPAVDAGAPAGGTAVLGIPGATGVTGPAAAAAGLAPVPPVPAPASSTTPTAGTGIPAVLPSGAAPTAPAGPALDVVTGPHAAAPAVPATSASAATAAGPALPSAGVLSALGSTGVVSEAVTSAAAGPPVATTAPAPAADEATSSGPAPSTAAGLPVAAASSPTGADTGAAGHDAGGEPAGDGSTAPVTGGVSGPAPTASAAATADADSGTGAVTNQPVAAQVARQVAVLRGAPDGSHTMTLVLTPETLGPVEVSVTVTQGTVDLVLRGAHEQSRVALLDALPDLRRDLESAGLVTSKLEVARDSGGSWLDRHAAGQQAQQGFGERPGQQAQTDGRSRPWLRTADSGETRTTPTTGSASTGVDVRV